MPDYTVTGGPDGTANVSIGSETFTPGETLAASAKSVKWLLEQGYLAPKTRAATPTDTEEA